MKLDVYVFPDIEALSRQAARLIIEAAEKGVKRKGFFTLALSGGNTPQRLYTLLAEEYRNLMPWHLTYLFWGDERNVPRDSLESNYHLAYETLISKIPIPAKNIHPVPTSPGNPEAAASEYENKIKKIFKARGVTSFDLVLLGLGMDGHTASLFPGDPILNEKEKWVAAVNAPPSYQTIERITLSLPAINNADQAIFMVTGSGKKDVVKTILSGSAEEGGNFPAALVQPKEELKWLLDADASEGLKRPF